MPAKTEKQRRFMALCATNPGKATKPCPPKSVATEFMHKPTAKKPAGRKR